MTDTRSEILRVLADLSNVFPDMRFGQLVDNLSFWAKGPDPGATWDVEDEEFLVEAKNQLLKRTSQLQKEPVLD